MAAHLATSMAFSSIAFAPSQCRSTLGAGPMGRCVGSFGWDDELVEVDWLMLDLHAGPDRPVRGQRCLVHDSG